MGTDSLYYIMDCSGNNYRTNQADQLVAMTGEQEKITDGEVVSPIKELTYDEVSEPVEKNVYSYSFRDRRCQL